jgi:hypothetical protein
VSIKTRLKSLCERSFPPNAGLLAVHELATITYMNGERMVDLLDRIQAIGGGENR